MYIHVTIMATFHTAQCTGICVVTIPSTLYMYRYSQ